MSEELTHIGPDGRARMVDVSGKETTTRTAVAEGRVEMSAAAFRLAADGATKKGDPKAIAELAGIMAAKRTHELIPLCHPLMLSKITVGFEELGDGTGLGVRSLVRTTGQTGVEIEALTAVSVACLTLYDMLKAADRTMEIHGIRLLEKSGGRSGTYRASVNQDA